MKQKIVFLLTIMLLPFIFYGCRTAPVKKATAPNRNMICDEKADEAMKEKRYEKSIILHEFFLKENPDNGLAMYHMGYSYGQLGDHEYEVKYYEKAIGLDFYGFSILFNLGMVYGEMGKYEDSLRVLKKATEMEPEKAENHFGLAFTYMKMTSYELAEKEFIKAIKLEPEDVDSIFFLSVCYAETGRINKAKDQLERLIEIAPDNEMTLKLKKILGNS